MYHCICLFEHLVWVWGGTCLFAWPMADGQCHYFCHSFWWCWRCRNDALQLLRDIIFILLYWGLCLLCSLTWTCECVHVYECVCCLFTGLQCRMCADPHWRRACGSLVKKKRGFRIKRLDLMQITCYSYFMQGKRHSSE